MTNPKLFSMVCGLFLTSHFAWAQESPQPENLLKTYESIQQAMASDEWESAKKLAGKAAEILKGPPTEFQKKIQEGVKALVVSQSDSDSRKAFGVYSEGVTALVRSDKNLQKSWQLFYCPMVPKGTYRYWVQAKGTELKNPYYGAKMLSCGVTRPW